MIDPIASPSLMAGSSEEKSCIARSYDPHEASVKGHAVYVRLIVAPAIISRSLKTSHFVEQYVQMCLETGIGRGGMSALGQKRIWRKVSSMSELRPLPDICRMGQHVRFVPVGPNALHQD